MDKQASDDEQPQHRLTLPEFYIGKYPVTNEQYAAFVKATGQAAPRHWKNGQIPAGKENHPVVNVSWRDAVAFCRWLSQASGKSLRLPTEAEWEKAARGRDGRIYPWGNQPPTKELCNFGGNVGDTTPVGQYPAGASPCGALDMAGNVWEWTGSLYRPYPYQPEDGRNSPDGEGPRVVRGGSWDGVRGTPAAPSVSGTHPTTSAHGHRFSGGVVPIVSDFCILLASVSCWFAGVLGGWVSGRGRRPLPDRGGVLWTRDMTTNRPD